MSMLLRFQSLSSLTDIKTIVKATLLMDLVDHEGVPKFTFNQEMMHPTV